jgi:superfamily II DNA or RNA helicase
MSHPLRDYQVKGVNDIFTQWKAGKKSVMFQLVTGGGKTVLFVDIIKKFIRAGKRVILIAHREELISQAWQTLYKNEILAGIIKSGTPENFHLPCQVASIQTICRRNRLPKADIVIIDECHHVLDDNSYGDVLLRHFPYAYVLGVTATPYRLGGRGFTKTFDVLVEGPPFTYLSERGYLCPFKYYVSYNPDLSKVKVQRGDYGIDDLEKAMELAPIVDSYLENCKGMSGISFAVNIEHSQKIVRQYLNAGIPAAHVDANTDIETRRNLFQQLRDKKILVLVNVGIATEGTDIPNIDFTQLCRPTKSLSMFLQMVGRGTRPLWDAIKNARSDEERRLLIATSAKPESIVLDNAGLYLEHGMPDQPFDWQAYFIGREKKKKPGIIEIIEFVAEKADGSRGVFKLPEEIEGLKLIEINHLEKQKVINLTSLKEFDKKFEILKRLPKITRGVGFIALRDYIDFCRKNSILMNDTVWNYLKKRLVDEPKEERRKLTDDLEKACKYIRENNTPEDAHQMIAAAKELHEGRIAKIARYAVPDTALTAEIKKYSLANEQALQSA